MMNFEMYLREHDIKVTPQRMTIVEELYKCGHLSVEELFLAIKSKFPSISLATIYKNINAMLDKSFLQEVKIPNQKSKYELTKEDHSHVVCQKCGKVEDISLSLHDVAEKAAMVSHYKINENDLVLSGICPNCQ